MVTQITGSPPISTGATRSPCASGSGRGVCAEVPVTPGAWPASTAGTGRHSPASRTATARVLLATFTTFVALQHGACHRFDRARLDSSADCIRAAPRPADDSSGMPDALRDVGDAASRLRHRCRSTAAPPFGSVTVLCGDSLWYVCCTSLDACDSPRPGRGAAALRRKGTGWTAGGLHAGTFRSDSRRENGLF